MLGHDHSVPRGQPTPEMREQRANYQPDGYSFISRRVLFKINVGLDLIRGIEIWWETRLQRPFPQQGAGETVKGLDVGPVHRLKGCETPLSCHVTAVIRPGHSLQRRPYSFA